MPALLQTRRCVADEVEQTFFIVLFRKTIQVHVRSSRHKPERLRLTRPSKQRARRLRPRVSIAVAVEDEGGAAQLGDAFERRHGVDGKPEPPLRERPHQGRPQPSWNSGYMTKPAIDRVAQGWINAFQHGPA